MTATIKTNQVSIKSHGILPDGVKYIELGLYDDYLTMPVAISFEGIDYGRTGWNSEKHIVYYRSDKKTGTIIA